MIARPDPHQASAPGERRAPGRALRDREPATETRRAGWCVIARPDPSEFAERDGVVAARSGGISGL